MALGDGKAIHCKRGKAIHCKMDKAIHCKLHGGCPIFLPIFPSFVAFSCLQVFSRTQRNTSGTPLQSP